MRVIDARARRRGARRHRSPLPRRRPAVRGRRQHRAAGPGGRELAEAGWQVVNVDATVVCERPRSGPARGADGGAAGRGARRRAARSTSRRRRTRAWASSAAARASRARGGAGRAPGGLSAAMTRRSASTHDSLRAAIARARASRAGQGRDLRLRPDRLLAASTSGTRGRTWCSRCSSASSSTRATTSPWSRTSPTSTTRSTTPPRSRACRPMQLAREMTDAYRADTDRLGLGRPDQRAARERDHRRDRRPDPGADRPRSRLSRRRATSTSACAASRATASSRTGASRTSPRRTQGEPDERAGAEAGPARLRALEGAQGRRGHGLGCAVGTRAAGVAHRVLGDGGEDPRPRLRHPRRRLRPRVPASRERDRPDGGRRAGRPLARIWMHNGMVRFGEEKMAKSVGNITHARRCARRVRPRRADHVSSSAATTASRSPSPPHRWRRHALRRASGSSTSAAARSRRRPRGRGRRPGCRAGAAATTSSPRCATTSTRPRRWRRCSSWSARATAGWEAGEPLAGAAAMLREMLRVLGLETLRTGPRTIDEEALRLLGEREEARRSRRLRARRRACATSCWRAATRSATRPRARCWSRAGG